MARQRMNPIPYQKHLEVFNDFSGGLNTVSSNDNLRDNELTNLVNVDLAERGSLKRRSGMVRIHVQNGNPIYPTGKSQGYFRFYRDNGALDELLAIDGKLYKDGVEVPIANLASFQTERDIEAVQFRDKLYIATGTKLVEYDGTIAKVVEPYTPQPLEALYIGTNALAPNPDQFITDGTSSLLRVDGITVNKRYGSANTGSQFIAYVSKPEGTVEYRWEWRKIGSETWNVFADFTADLKQFGFIVPTGDYEIKVRARMQGDTLESEYYIPKYTVLDTDKPPELPTNTLQQCNRILLHWNRIILYGDPNQKGVMYFSDLDRPGYFPTLNTLSFENERREELTAMVEFRDMLVAFTPHSIQALFGSSPEDYRRVLLSNSVGCIAPYSAKVMENYVTFLSQEGIYILKSLGYTENRLNVQKIDTPISNIVPKDEDACAIVLDGQYQITFPQRKMRLRSYYQMGGVWTKDESEKLNLIRIYEFDGVAYGLGQDAKVYRFDSDVYTDDGYVYTDEYETKSFDFGQPYHPKKLKELKMLFGSTTQLMVNVYADSGMVIGPENDYASVDEEGNIVWNTELMPNVKIQGSTVFGTWVMGESAFGFAEAVMKELPLSGKCLRTSIRIVHSKPNPNHVLGLGYVFKLKKP